MDEYGIDTIDINSKIEFMDKEGNVLFSFFQLNRAKGTLGLKTEKEK